MFQNLKQYVKLVFLISIAVFIMNVPAYAGFSDEAVLGNNRWKIDSSGRLAPDSNTGGSLALYEVFTTGETITATESGKVCILDTSSVSGSPTTGPQFLLPDAAVGLQYTFTAGNGNYVIVRPQSGDKIAFSTCGNGDAIRSSGATSADSVSVVAASSSKWVVTDMKGTWTNYKQ